MTQSVVSKATNPVTLVSESGVVQEFIGGVPKVSPGAGATISLATDVVAISTQSAVAVSAIEKSIEVILTGTGAISASISVYGAHTSRNTNGTLIGTLAPNGTTTAVDSIPSNVPYPYLFTDVTAISGTSASLDITVGF